MKALWLSLPLLALTIVSTGLALTTQPPLAIELPPTQAETAEELAKKTGCFQCHSVDEKVIGPAFRDIAARYKNDNRARAALMKTIRDGSKGKWIELTGGAPMPPHSARLSAAEIERLVDWVLTR